MTFWLSAPQPQPVAGPRRDRGRHPPHRHPRPGRLLHARATWRSCRARSSRAGTALVGARAGRPAPRRCSASPGLRGLLSDSRRPATRCWSGCRNAVPSCAVTAADGLPVAGVGVDPRRPPLVWEAWTGTGWAPCEVDHDDTGGLNKAGDVVLHVPDEPPGAPSSPGSGPAGCGAGWSTPLPGQPTYTAPPRIIAVTAFTDRRHGADGARRGAARTRRSAAPTARPASGSRCSAGPWCPRTSRGTLEVRDEPRATRSGPRCAHFAESATGGPALPDRPRRRRGAVRPGGAAGRRHAPRTTAPSRRAARLVAADVVPHRRRAQRATSPRDRCGC